MTVGFIVGRRVGMRVGLRTGFTVGRKRCGRFFAFFPFPFGPLPDFLLPFPLGPGPGPGIPGPGPFIGGASFPASRLCLIATGALVGLLVGTRRNRLVAIKFLDVPSTDCQSP
jgi:hypothetical protein